MKYAANFLLFLGVSFVFFILGMAGEKQAERLQWNEAVTACDNAGTVCFEDCVHHVLTDSTENLPPKCSVVVHALAEELLIERQEQERNER